MDAKLILNFLKALKKNNDRDWFTAQADRFAKVKTEFEVFIAAILEPWASGEPDLAYLQPKDCIYRLHRDLRFSKDKTPYKTHMSAFIVPGGKSSGRPGWYIHLEPGGQSMVAGGHYMPTPSELNNIRSRIVANPDELRKILSAKAFKANFPDGVNGERSKSVRNFPKDHPAADLIQIKSHIAFHKLTDEQVLSPGLTQLVVDGFKALSPYIRWVDSARLDPEAARRPKPLF